MVYKRWEKTHRKKWAINFRGAQLSLNILLSLSEFKLPKKEETKKQISTEVITYISELIGHRNGHKLFQKKNLILHYFHVVVLNMRDLRFEMCNRLPKMSLAEGVPDIFTSTWMTKLLNAWIFVQDTLIYWVD